MTECHRPLKASIRGVDDICNHQSKVFEAFFQFFEHCWTYCSIQARNRKWWNPG